MKTIVIVCIYLVVFSSAPQSLSLSNSNIRFRPSTVEINGFTQSFPLTWQRRFLSSVPFREKALDDITITLSNLCLIRGASSSGKSTLLKAIHQQSTAGMTSGTITIISSNESSPAKPIYLDQKPPYENRRSIQEVIERQWSRIGDQSSTGLDEGTRQEITSMFAGYLGFQYYSPSHPWLQQKPSQLSPSETYRFALLLACLESSCSSGVQRNNETLIPAPILLIDEWMDTETSTVIQAVQKSLWTLVQLTGALVCVVTHKAERWKLEQIDQTITLSAGRVLQVDS